MYPRIIAMLLLFLLSITPLTYAQPQLSDLHNHWSKAYVSMLIEKRVIDGYPDGRFLPDNPILIGEFLKVMVCCLGQTETQPNTLHWAWGYYNAARKLGLVFDNEDDLKALDLPITRGQMARLISRSLKDTYPNYELVEYASLIRDYTPRWRNAMEILHTFRAGIITGYPSGDFIDGGQATRAEASTMLCRLIDSSMRIPPQLPYAIGLNISESTEPDRFDLYISLDMTFPVETQYEDLDHYLRTHGFSHIADEVIHNCKLKFADRSFELRKSYPWSTRGSIDIVCQFGNPIFVIRGDDGVND